MGIRGWIIFSVVAVGVIATLFFVSRSNSIDVSETNTGEIIGAEDANGNIADHVYGSTEQKVTLIEYADYQCPGCKAAAPYVKEVREKYKDNLTFILRNYPLTSIHPNARAAAATAEAAGLQGKFWEMSDLLFENQDNWKDATLSDRATVFEGYANELGLDMTQFQNDSGSNEVVKKINFDVAVGKKDDVSQTPTLILNGEKLTDDQMRSAEALSAAVEAALTAAGVKL